KGMDLSTMWELEQLGAKYYDKGKERELLDIMKDYDVDTIRLRLWLDPYSEDGKPYGAGTNDLETTLNIAKKVTRAGLNVLLNFHYSDFWTDPAKQIKPKAWANYDAKQLEKAVYEYTVSVMERFQRENIRLSMVQVGNEVTNGLLWPEGKWPNYDNIAKFLNAGIRAVRKVNPEIPIMIHLDQGGNNEIYVKWMDEFFKRAEDFDIIGLSYYPFWHGTLEKLRYNMNDLSIRYKKDLVVVEVSMGFTLEDYKEHEKLEDGERKGYATKPDAVENLEYPMTKEGQAEFMRELLEIIADVPEGRGKGFFYWEPAWLPRAGSGWATRESLAYMNDPGPCGNEWANQALFDYDGNILPAFDVIRDFPRN
ncbi:MAG: arabinogalactan endo-beta-1,4-galactanase, partial [Lachnospiraceae bacterium]